MDSIVTDSVETNPYTNPNGKNVIRTKAAGDIQNTPRELGGEERERKGH